MPEYDYRTQEARRQLARVGPSVEALLLQQAGTPPRPGRAVLDMPEVRARLSEKTRADLGLLSEDEVRAKMEAMRYQYPDIEAVQEAGERYDTGTRYMGPEAQKGVQQFLDTQSEDQPVRSKLGTMATNVGMGDVAFQQAGSIAKSEEKQAGRAQGGTSQAGWQARAAEWDQISAMEPGPEREAAELSYFTKWAPSVGYGASPESIQQAAKKRAVVGGVDVGLAKTKQRALMPGEIEEFATKKAIGFEYTQKEKDANQEDILAGLGLVKALANGVKPSGRLLGSLRKGGAWAGIDPTTASLQNTAGLLAGQVAKKIGGESGRLTDQDRLYAMNVMPKVTDTKEERRIKMAVLDSFSDPKVTGPQMRKKLYIAIGDLINVGYELGEEEAPARRRPPKGREPKGRQEPLSQDEQDELDKLLGGM